MTTLLLTHPSFLIHDSGSGHPECADRIRAIDKELEREPFSSLIRRQVSARSDTFEWISTVHNQAHIKELERIHSLQQDYTHLDSDTVMSPGTWEAAIRAVDSGLTAVDSVLDTSSEVVNAFCQVRPPGHHAEKDRAMGFCFFSNIAIAAHYAHRKHGLNRVAVIDFDVHHGNGTQQLLCRNKSFFYGSTHQALLFPGTGSVSQEGVGNVINISLQAGDGGDVFRKVCENLLFPKLCKFAPDLLLISAGFDAHKFDPLGGLNLTEDDYFWVTQRLVKIAGRFCRGRIVSMLEGGYEITALARSVGIHVLVLMEGAG